MYSHFKRAVCCALASLLALPPSPAQAGGIPNPFARCKTNMERLAEEIDCLEHALNEQGTVVAKSPDIWGEARLTRHRQEFEKKLEAELDGFRETYNASIRTTDQAFLGAALAVSTALSNDNAPDLTLLNNLSVGAVATSDKTKAESVPIVRTAPGGLFAAGTQFGFKDDHPKLEPVIRLDQLKRYLDHLHEIRRINEGDDTTDTPGYSLNLVRIPISVLPGAATRKGHGAEISVTATPHITPELLPTIFRQLVINDLIDQWHAGIHRLAIEYTRASEVPPTATASDPTDPPSIGKEARLPFRPPVFGLDGGDHIILKPKNFIQEEQATTGERPPNGNALPKAPNQREFIKKTLGTPHNFVAVSTASRRSRLPIPSSQLADVFGTGWTSVAFDFYSRQVDSLPEVAGERKGVTTSQKAIQRLTSLDVRAYLKDEVEAAYDYLNAPAHVSFWNMVPAIAIAVRENNVVELRTLRESVIKYRDYARNRSRDETQWRNDADSSDVACALQGKPNPGQEIRETPVSVLAWAVLVHSALLNEQLNEDIKRVSLDPNCHCLSGDCPLAFFGPAPNEVTRQAFISYVKCRWPVHIFTLDPVSQDQNVIDTFSMRRELQLAFALSIATGNISGSKANLQNMERYARRLELDMETVALNKTAVGFSHGEDTFGWRFYPRVQTPGIQSNTTVAFRDLMVGGPSKDALRKQWELEPGMRECVALVVMPSFIDHMRFDVRGNYFKLCSPDRTRASVKCDVRWSERIRTMQNYVEAVVGEQDLYRDGEIDRLLRRVDQLERKLPLQTVFAKVPNENTFGGFEMFSRGTTDLAPELFGFYGEPGVDPTAETQLFLQGENFSVHGTRVIVGNQSCEYELLSRQIMRVTIPPGVRPQWEGTVDVHIATPYGVTNHLDIPVIGPVLVPGYAFALTEIPLLVQYRIDAAKKEPVFTQTRIRRPHEISVQGPPNVHLPDSMTVVLDVRVVKDDATILLKSYSKDVGLNQERRAYVLTGGDFVDFIQQLRTEAAGQLKDADGRLPPRVDFEVVGRLTTTKDIVGGKLHLTVKFDEVN